MNQEFVAGLLPDIKEALRLADRSSEHERQRQQLRDQNTSESSASVSLFFVGNAIVLVSFFLLGWPQVGFVAFGTMLVIIGGVQALVVARRSRHL